MRGKEARLHFENLVMLRYEAAIFEAPVLLVAVESCLLAVQVYLIQSCAVGCGVSERGKSSWCLGTLQV